MGQVADRYIRPSGRMAGYDRAAFIDDLCTAANFLAWCEHEQVMMGGVQAGDAFRAVCRMLDVEPIQLRKIALGE